MPVSSITPAIWPPSASISLTRWPLATPPIAGLHDICATISRLPVSTSTRAPILAAASAAIGPVVYHTSGRGHPRKLELDRWSPGAGRRWHTDHLDLLAVLLDPRL